MHRLSVPAVLLALAAVTACMSLGLRTDAQQVTEVLRLRAGDTLELSTDTPSPNPQFSWILTRDRKFQSAQRSRFFQTRFAQAGAYVLDVSVQSSGGGTNDYRAFSLMVDEAVADQTAPPVQNDTAPLQAAVRIEPPILEGNVYVPANGGMIKIDPSLSQGKITTYDLDLDSSVDTDGDGNPTNDKDTLDTLSQKNGTPIYLYVLPKNAPRTITLSVTNLSTPAPSALSFNVVFGGTPPAGALSSASSSASAGTPVNTGGISVEQNELTATFRTNLDRTQTTGKELLFAWDFGDRGKSLLDTPTHIYAAAGSYPVTLTVTDIATGQIFFTSNGSVTVIGPAQTSSSSSSQVVISSVSSSETGSETGDGSGLPIGAIITVGLIIFVLLALAIGLYAVIHWIKGKATGKLQDTLEKMEKTIVKKDTKTEVIEGTVEPMKLKKDAVKADEPAVVKEKEMAKTEFTSSTRTNETPSAHAGPVPSWLAKGGTPSTPAATPTPAKPVEQKAPDWLKPQATPAPKQSAPAIAAPTTAAAAPVPDWLKPKSATPTPIATPAPKPASPSAPTQVPPVQAAPQTQVPAGSKAETGPVPDWLKPKAPTPASPAPATATAPAPTPVVTPKPVTEPAPKAQPTQAPVVPEQKKPVTPQVQNEKPMEKTKVELPTPPEPKQPQAPSTPASPAPATATAPAPTPVVTPKPVEAPKPQPAPVKTEAPKAEAKPAAEPTPKPQPTQTPVIPEQKKPVAPQVQNEKPIEKPKAELPKSPEPKPAPKPLAQPKNEEPKQPQAPAAPTSMPVQLSMSPTPKPKAPAAPIASTPEKKTPPDDDQTIAIIQADSLTK